MLHAVHQTSVWGSGRGQHGNEYHEDDACSNWHWIDAELVGEVQYDWHENDGHGGVVRKVGEDQSDGEHDGNEYHFTATAEDRGQAADEEVRHTGSLVRKGVGAVNGCCDHEENAPVKLTICSFFEVEKRFALPFYDQEQADPENGNPERPKEAKSSTKKVIREEAWEQDHDQVNRDHVEIELLLQVHWRQRHLFFDHRWIYSFELGKVNAKNELNEDDVDGHDQGGHNKVNSHIRGHWDGHWVTHSSGHALEGCIRDQLSAHEWEQWLGQGAGCEHTDEEIFPETVFSLHAEGFHEAEGDRPQNDECGDRAADCGQCKYAGIEYGPEYDWTTLEDLTGQEPFCNVLGIADGVHGTKENHCEQGQEYGVVTNGVHPEAIEAAFAAITGDTQHEQTDQRWPESVTGTPQINHAQEGAYAAHPKWGDRADRWHEPEEGDDTEADDQMNRIQIKLFLCFTHFSHPFLFLE